MMKAIIPVKDNSERIPHKNFIPFHGEDSLFDILVKKLLKVFEPEDIFMSCENPTRQDLAQKYGIEFLLREPEYSHNDCPFDAWFNYTYDQVCEVAKGEPDVMWAQVCDPIFNEHKEMLEVWEEVSKEGNADSLVVSYPFKGYLLNPSMEPLGWGFGSWHVKSQDLPTYFLMPFTCSILKAEAVRFPGYHVGAYPEWFIPTNQKVDIDTPFDWSYAQALYEHEQGNAQE